MYSSTADGTGVGFMVLLGKEGGAWLGLDMAFVQEWVVDFFNSLGCEFYDCESDRKEGKFGVR